ncbi:MAG: RsfS/YbeB/iojap family protein [Butyricimonas faecihominis]
MSWNFQHARGQSYRLCLRRSQREIGRKTIARGRRTTSPVGGVLDYGNVVVHIFQKEQRDYYQLEDFWADAEITNVEEN